MNEEDVKREELLTELDKMNEEESNIQAAESEEGCSKLGLILIGAAGAAAIYGVSKLVRKIKNRKKDVVKPTEDNVDFEDVEDADFREFEGDDKEPEKKDSSK